MSGDEVVRWMDYAWHGVILVAIAAVVYGILYSRWSGIVDQGPEPGAALAAAHPATRPSPPRPHAAQASAVKGIPASIRWIVSFQPHCAVRGPAADRTLPPPVRRSPDETPSAPRRGRRGAGTSP
jgi:hypothetical protein